MGHLILPASRTPLTARNSIAVRAGASAREILRGKTQRAARDAGIVPALMAAGQEGMPQRASESYFSSRNRSARHNIDDPARYSAEGIWRRLHAFEFLNARTHGKRCDVTGLREGEGESSRLSFVMGDRRILPPRRLMYLPLPPCRLFGLIRREGAN